MPRLTTSQILSIIPAEDPDIGPEVTTNQEVQSLSSEMQMVSWLLMSGMTLIRGIKVSCGSRVAISVPYWQCIQSTFSTHNTNRTGQNFANFYKWTEVRPSFVSNMEINLPESIQDPLT